ncbi:lasso peptide biosynthesis B2 protein [Erythrobacter insulae]|nr:lasso peptide biosynthesis B2 protein [Erythrobacter insulae]
MSPIRSLKTMILRAEIILGLMFARVLIKLVPFRWWKRLLGPIDSQSHSDQQRLSAKQIKQASDIGRMIKRLARKQKFEAVCFPQAITGRWILKRRGIPSNILIGSRKDPGTGMAFHAWLKVGDQVVTGQHEY